MISNVLAPTIPSIISYGRTPIVAAPVGFFSYPDGGNLQVSGIMGVTALELLRSVRQPLPGELCACALWREIWREGGSE